MIPLQLIRVRLPRRIRPGLLLLGEGLPAEDAALCRRVARRRDDRTALGAVGVAGEFRVAAVDTATFQEQLGPVREGVLDRVVVKVLVDEVAAVVSAARALGLDG